MTRKEKQEEKKRIAKIKEQRRLDQERANKFRVSTTEKGLANMTVKDGKLVGDGTYASTTTKTPGRKNVGAIKSQGGSDGNFNDADVYADGSRFEKTKDTSDNQSKLSKRVANRQINKTARKNKRAEKLAVRKGMSPQQAKDFMQNRRDRFRQMGTNFVKGLTGQAMDTAVDDRLYRRDGSGTLQNMKTEDGKTYDATAPYKGTMAKNYSDRGKPRNEADDYIKSLNPKKDDSLSEKMITIPFRKAPEPKDVIREDTENRNKISLTPHSGKYNYHKVDSSDQPYSATENVTQSENIYTPEQQRLNEMRKSEFGRKAPLGSSLGMSMFGLPLGAASGMINLAGNLISGKGGDKQKKNIDKFAGRSGG